LRIKTTNLMAITACACAVWVSPGSGAAVLAQDRAAGGQHRPHAGMLRYPDVSASEIAFVYANDIWKVSRDGGVATRVAGPAGVERFPRFSPDGKNIAFVGNYDGNVDLYTLPTEGGIAQRITFHPSGESLCDWTADGRLIYHFGGLGGKPGVPQLFTIDAKGGPPEKLPVPYGANGAISADGQWLAYTPHARDSRTWKRYRGGMASDVWLFHLKNHTSKQATDWDGTDSLPMWHGGKVYYLSDQGPEHRLNIWSYDPGNGQRKQITKFDQYDVKWPAMGPGANGGGEIVFQNGTSLYLLDLTNGKSKTVDVRIPGDRPTIRNKMVDASKKITAWDISSTGKRAVFSARGDIWTVPAKKGSPRNLTRSSGVAERDPYWSPDGQWISYFSDETGEYELYITQSDGKGETRKLTDDGNTFRHHPRWSPDSKYLTISDKTGAFYLYELETGKTTHIDTDPWAQILSGSWSSDSNWISYARAGENQNGSIYLYNVTEGTSTQVTSEMFNDGWPVFGREGKYLFFASNRNFTSWTGADLDTTFIYADTQLLFAVPLREEVGSPWAPESDEEEWGDEDSDDEDADDDESDKEDADKKDEGAKKSSGDKDDDNDKQSDAKDDENDEGDDKSDDDEDKDEKKEPEPVEIELEGFERRAIKVPVDRGTFSALGVNDKGHLMYVRSPRRGSKGKAAIKIFDLDDDDKKEKTVLTEYGAFALSADGKKLIARKGNGFVIVDAAPDQKTEKAKVSLSAITANIDPREEWAQVFNESWRIQRDYFYDPNMHGVNWPAMRDHYGAMIKDCASREDVTFVIGEMISELNVGHAYVRGGFDREKQPSVSVGMLGVDFALENGAYRIKRIIEGASWDFDARGPLSQPNVDVNEGDYLLEVNGVPVDSEASPYAAFQGLAGRTITLTVSKNPTMDDEARRVIVKPSSGEYTLRFRSWIERNRAYVDDKTDGRVGYIYVPNTATQGRNELFRQFFGQRHKDALIIDERWNGGGFIPNRIIELLNRPVRNYWARRHGRDWHWPPDSHQGPKCMLINGMAGSGGDCFPYYFRQQGLGKLIGMRTWGGLVGITGYPRLVDGGGVTAPSFAFYETDGTWGIEGHGVEPDILVVDDPAKMVDGGDPQLDAAITQMLKEIQANPYRAPKRPAYPDRAGMGIPDEDK
jgi:tricorn protease